MTALAEEKPSENEDRTAKSKQAVFDWVWPAGGKEDNSINKSNAKSIDITASEDNFFGEREIATGERVFGAIIWVAKYLTVHQKVATDR